MRHCPSVLRKVDDHETVSQKKHILRNYIEEEVSGSMRLLTAL